MLPSGPPSQRIWGSRFWSYSTHCAPLPAEGRLAGMMTMESDTADRPVSDGPIHHLCSRHRDPLPPAGRASPFPQRISVDTERAVQQDHLRPIVTISIATVMFFH